MIKWTKIVGNNMQIVQWENMDKGIEIYIMLQS